MDQVVAGRERETGEEEREERVGGGWKAADEGTDAKKRRGREMSE